MLAEYEGRSLLLTGDAHARVLEAGLRRLAEERDTSTIAVDAVKVPHHGSRYNLSNELVSILDCERWVFSTDGSIFGHPDPEAIARIVVDRPGMQLLFNYRTVTTDRYASARLSRAHRLRTAYPDSDGAIVIEV